MSTKGVNGGKRPCTKKIIKERRQKNKWKKNVHNGRADYKANAIKLKEKEKRIKDAKMSIFAHNRSEKTGWL